MSQYLPIGVGICLIAAGLAGLGIGIAASRACDAVGRQPEAQGKISAMLIIGCALAESCAIYGFVTGLIMFFSK